MRAPYKSKEPKVTVSRQLFIILRFSDCHVYKIPSLTGDFLSTARWYRKKRKKKSILYQLLPVTCICYPTEQLFILPYVIRFLYLHVLWPRFQHVAIFMLPSCLHSIHKMTPVHMEETSITTFSGNTRHMFQTIRTRLLKRHSVEKEIISVFSGKTLHPENCHWTFIEWTDGFEPRSLFLKFPCHLITYSSHNYFIFLTTLRF